MTPGLLLLLPIEVEVPRRGKHGSMRLFSTMRVRFQSFVLIAAPVEILVARFEHDLDRGAAIGRVDLLPRG